jgi:arylsulfatase A-like enzyme
MKTKPMSLNPRIQYLGIFIMIFTFSLASFGQQKPKKNIVLVMADDFNYWNKLQGYYPLVKTPNIDKLASKGVLFADAQASAPVCNPSRAAMWSGFRPSTTGIEGNSGGHIRGVAPFQNVVTMNQYFKDNGYYVYGIGKLYHGSAGGGPESDMENFSFYSTKAIGCGAGTFLNFTATNGSDYKWSVNEAAMTRANCRDYDVAVETASQISGYATSANKDKPFFMACGVSKPHLAWYLPKQFYDLFKREDIVIPSGYKANDLADTAEGTHGDFTYLTGEGKWEEAIHMYISALALADHNAGVIFDAVENSTYKDNTIVVFMGDHGWHLGEKNRFGKASVWDMSNKTTLVIYDPSNKNTSGSPKICKKVVSLQDIYPTLVELSGLPIKTDIEGNSLAALIENPDKANWDKPVLVSRVFDRLRTNKWSYAIDRTTPANNMLYDIVNDPNEFDNLLHVNQTKMPKAEVATIKARLDFQFDSIKNIGLTMKTKLANSYKFTPKTLSIPGTIEAEDYDEGGYQQTYFDADKTNAGGQYRTADGTDIYTTSDTEGLYHLGGLSTGEWMNYTVKDYLAGKYTVDFRVKNTGASPAVIQIFNRDVLLGEFSIPASTNSWTSIQAPELILTEQNSTRLQVKIKSGSGVEFNTMKFAMSSLSNPEITANIKRKCLTNTLVTDGILYLDLNGTDTITTIYVYDINGKLISKETMPGEQSVAYSLGKTLSPGVYLLRVEDDFVSSVEKFIVR